MGEFHEARVNYFDEVNVGGWKQRGKIIREQDLWAIAKDRRGTCEIWVDGRCVGSAGSYDEAKKKITKCANDMQTACRQRSCGAPLETCSYCGGSGEQYGHTCIHCEGVGQICSADPKHN